MHPAYSVILFTTASGAGFGLLVWLGVAVLLGHPGWSEGFILVAFGLAMVLTVGGLLSSTFHLGRPERAWRAFSQWRTSWLSREGVLAVAALGLGALLALTQLLPGLVPGIGSLAQPVAALLILTALGTVWCTGMIYQSLTTIPAWNHRYVTAIYLLLGLASGLVLMHLVQSMLATRSSLVGHTALFLAIVAGLAKVAYWRGIDGAAPRANAGSATGLGGLGKVRPLDLPHVGQNYIMREMGYSVARRHAEKLRRLVIITMTMVPVALLLLSFVVGPGLATVLVLLAALSMAIGVVTERWLFFAEARHVVNLYYGADAV